MEKRQLLEKIHERQAERMLEILERGEPTAQELNAITKFLSDNGIDLQSAVKPVKQLTKRLGFVDPDLNVRRAE